MERDNSFLRKYLTRELCEELNLFQYAKKKFEDFMEQSGVIEVEEEQEANYKDLRYLVMDILFLANDLAHFYKCDELGRFKMRALNYFNKRRRADMFGSANSGTSCPIM